MSFLSNRNGLSVGVSQYVALSPSPSAVMITPTLSLNFTNTETLDPRITFTRASSGTRFNSSGVLVTMGNDQARFDYNPITLASNGLLIEEQRTNLLTYSEQFSDVAWVKSNSSITANTIVAPDGTLTGDKLVENTANAAHSVSQFNPVSGTSYTVSIYAKAAERSRLTMSGGGFGAQGFAVTFDLLNGILLTNTGNKGAILFVGNGWYRCSISFTASSTVSFAYTLVDNSNNATYTGDGYSGLYIWGAQLEAGAFPTSYIPTVAAQVTRSADVAVMTGTNFSSWYNASEGTLYAEMQIATNRNYSGTFRHVATISPASSLNSSVQLLVTGFNNFSFDIRNNAAAQASLISGTNTGSINKLVGAYQVNNFAFSVNNNTAATDTSGQAPVSDPPTQIVFGQTRDGNILGVLNGTIRKIVYYPQRLPNAQLQALTV